MLYFCIENGKFKDNLMVFNDVDFTYTSVHILMNAGDIHSLVFGGDSSPKKVLEMLSSVAPIDWNLKVIILGMVVISCTRSM